MKKGSFQVLTLLADIIILAISFIIMVWLKPASKTHYLPSHLDFFVILAGIWIIISILSGKMHRGKVTNLKSLFSRTISSNLVSLALAVLLMITFDLSGHSRLIMFGTTALATFFELVVGIVFISVKKVSYQDYQSPKEFDTIHSLTEEEIVGETDTDAISDEALKTVTEEVQKALIDECGEELAIGILNIAKGKLNSKSRIISTTTTFNISSLRRSDYAYIINIKKINDIKKLDHFLDAVNYKVASKGYFLCCVETKNLRKRRILKKYPPLLNRIYYFFDFILKRIFPKIRLTRWIWMWLTGGNNVVMSRAEALGRMARAGFSISNESFINGSLFIEGRKIKEPLNIYGKHYGVLIALPRIGRNGQLIKVLKLRSMHPYSEYIQDYVYGKNKLQPGGKLKNDYRITTWGAFSRTVWLDELPMLLNLLKGNMKLVGVRPLSQQYFKLYSKELQEKRTRVKPGLIPPFYYDMPGNLKEIQESELKYLESYRKKPVRTDIRYFFKSVFNILFRKARSS